MALFAVLEIPVKQVNRKDPPTFESFCLATAPGLYRWRNEADEKAGFGHEVDLHLQSWPIGKPMPKKQCVVCKKKLPRGGNVDPSGGNTSHHQFFKTSIWRLKRRADGFPLPYRCELCRHGEIIRSLTVCDAGVVFGLTCYILLFTLASLCFCRTSPMTFPTSGCKTNRLKRMPARISLRLKSR